MAIEMDSATKKIILQRYNKRKLGKLKQLKIPLPVEPQESRSEKKELLKWTHPPSPLL